MGISFYACLLDRGREEAVPDGVRSRCVGLLDRGGKQAVLGRALSLRGAAR